MQKHIANLHSNSVFVTVVGFRDRDEKPFWNFFKKVYVSCKSILQVPVV